MVETFQSRVHRLGDEADDGQRGLRFCFGHEANTQAGVFLPWLRVAARVRGMAALLAANGVGGGDVVVVHAHDQQAALLAILGAIHLGAIPAAVAPLGAGAADRLVEQFHAVVAVAAPRLIVADRELPAEHVGGRPLPPVLVAPAAPEAATAPVARLVGPGDPCFLQFTSGSTSVPKGVVVTQRMLLANLASITAVVGWGPHGRLVGWLPIYHDMSLVGLYCMAVYNRARACFFPPTRFGRSPDLWLGLMAEERADFSAGPNFAFAMVERLAARRPPSADLSCVKGIICGSEPIAAGIMQRFTAIHAACGLVDPVMPAFGMAECTLMATACPPGAPLVTLVVEREALEQRGRVVGASRDGLAAADGPTRALELVGCGAAGPGMSVAIAVDGALAGEDRVGEILLAGDSVLTEYWRNPAATAAAFTAIAGRRWFRTGDLGFLHGGQLYVCGRAKDLIIHNGVNYHPADVEAALQAAMPERVRLAAVVDLRHDLAAPFIGLGVLFEEGKKAEDAVAAQAAVGEFVARYTGLPVAVAVALRGGEHIPRTTSGKLVRAAIRQRLNAALAGAGPIDPA
jgi:acyl-CoA synthetase (AMP-forming)/AMP-acid ligase II